VAVAAEIGPNVGTLKLKLKQGTAYTIVLTYKPGGTPADLTGYTARAQIREDDDSTTAALSFTSATGGGITFDADRTTGKIYLRIKATQTSPLTITGGKWDLELVPASGEDDAFAIVEGAVTITREVTR
jgi:hypothetical protein